jgi:putative acetyltransferase
VVAEENGHVVAFALLSRIMIGGEPGLALGPVAVAPERQRQGLGTAVVRDVLRRATEARERLVLVLGEPAYYGRFGFVAAAPYGITSEWSSAGDAWQVLALRAVEARYPAPWRGP